jgi:hypothetical protein
MRAQPEKRGGAIPPPAQGAEEREEHQEREHGFRGPSRGDANHNRVQKVEGHQKGGATVQAIVAIAIAITIILRVRYGCQCCVFAAIVCIRASAGAWGPRIVLGYEVGGRGRVTRPLLRDLEWACGRIVETSRLYISIPARISHPEKRYFPKDLCSHLLGARRIANKGV